MAEEIHLALDEEMERTLEAVRQQQGLETKDQAAEWLLRRRMRKGVGNLTGRGRALYEVRGRSD
ncbi:hypothetical protein [Vreelandella aquamarina]|jgi:hypothetical protein|uniref:hypothetical protein n=1 Tax=Vreelandella aquamarina TaxID=77097 RepID=UPI001D178C44|nr:hypothetical protein [Halomonas axialensis]MCC4290456.1 hypothetical protein [Halomonas axialensis]